MKILQLCVLAGLLNVFTACTNTPNESEASSTGSNSSSWYGSISGQILAGSGASDSSVVGAKIEVVSHPELNTTADAEGKYEIKNAQPANYTLVISSAVLGNQKPSFKIGLFDTGAAYGLKIDGINVESGKVRSLPKSALKRTGKISGKIDFFTNPNNLDLTGSDVYIPGTSYLVKTASDGSFLMAGVPPGDYTLRAEHTGFVHTEFSVTVAENSTTSVGTKLLSISNGPEGSIGVTGAQNITIAGQSRLVISSREVTVSLSYDSDAALMKIADESAFLNKQWIPVSSSYNFAFSSDGPKRLFVKFSDLNGLESSPYFVDFIVDTEAPVLSAVSLLNGWEQAASPDISVDILGSDSGTGIKEVIFSNTLNVFASDDAWQSYSSRMNWNLSSGSGSKSVSIKVRDYLGRTSNIVSDSINIGTATYVYKKNYTENMTFEAKQSPYFIAETTTFEGPLTLEAGTTVHLAPNARLEIKGAFKAQGTSLKPITFAASDVTGLSNCATRLNPYVIRFDQGTPDINKDYVLDYVHFKSITEIYLNGGSVTHSKFDGMCTPMGYGNDYYGKIYKKGLNNLNFSYNEFKSWSLGLSIDAGDGNTAFDNNFGSVKYGLVHTSNSRGTSMANNSLDVWEILLAFGSPEASANSYWGDGALTFVGNTTTGNCRTGVYLKNSNAITLNNLSLNSCQTAIEKIGAGTVNINRLSASNCSLGINSYHTSINAESVAPGAVAVNDSVLSCSTGISNTNASISMNYSEITASQAVIAGGYGAYGAGGTISIDHSKLSCANESGFCDLFLREMNWIMSSVTDEVQIQNSILDCKGNASSGCRGFTFYDSNTNGHSVSANLNLTLNNFAMSAGSKNLTASTLSDANDFVGNELAFNSTSNASNVGFFKFIKSGQSVTVNKSLNITNGAPPEAVGPR